MTSSHEPGSRPRYGPADISGGPRYGGVRTFARCPLVTDPEGVDVAVVGVAFDTTTTLRPGARFGPDGIRTGSMMIRPYHPLLDVNVFETLSVVDWGGLDVTPGNAARTLDQIAEGLTPLVTAGVIPIVLGGDHTIALGELRAHAAVHGPMALVLLDAHADTWDEYWGERYFHGTPFRRALEEGLLLPERSLLAGMRGSLYDRGDMAATREFGFEVIEGTALRQMSPEEYGRRVRARVGDAPVFFSFDIDFVDPAFAPGTGTPEVGGPSAREALDLVRSLAGMEFKGFDVVEVSPPFDTPGQNTVLLAAGVVYEFLALTAVAKRQGD
jgi:agmatinase